MEPLPPASQSTCSMGGSMGEKLKAFGDAAIQKHRRQTPWENMALCLLLPKKSSLCLTFGGSSSPSPTRTLHQGKRSSDHHLPTRPWLVCCREASLRDPAGDSSSPQVAGSREPAIRWGHSSSYSTACILRATAHPGLEPTAVSSHTPNNYTSGKFQSDIP